MLRYCFLHNFRNKFRIESIQTAFFISKQAFMLECFERRLRTCINRVTTITSKGHQGGVALVQLSNFEPVTDLRLNSNQMH
jgi:hypothetical protein